MLTAREDELPVLTPAETYSCPARHSPSDSDSPAANNSNQPNYVLIVMPYDLIKSGSCE